MYILWEIKTKQMFMDCGYGTMIRMFIIGLFRQPSFNFSMLTRAVKPTSVGKNTNVSSPSKQHNQRPPE